MHLNRKQEDSSNLVWTKDVLSLLYRLRHEEERPWHNVADALRKETGLEKTEKAIKRKYGRIDWNSFFQNPDKYVIDKAISAPKKWSHEEMIQLDAYLQAGKSYDFVAEKLGRSISSVESQAQHTDWEAWKKIKDVVSSGSDVVEHSIEEKQQIMISQLVGAFLTICRSEFERIDSIKEKEFLERVNLSQDKLIISFQELKKKAKEELIALGYGNPENINLGEGTYIVIGDSHGKHTNRSMFAMLERVNDVIKPDKIIHIGHILDDNNDISYDWGRFKNLIILSKQEELRIIQEQRNKYKFTYDIVREDINVGDVVITNQDLITDYTRTPISSLDKQIFDAKVIVNCHRHEFSTRCCNKEVSYFASPGCLCENHNHKTIKQINFEDGRIVKQAFHDGFIKYRRMKYTNKYWERGMIVIHVDKDENVTLVPCVIKETSKGFTTSYFDKIITSKGVFKPEKKIFVNGDMHCDLHDTNVLDVQEQICKDYKPDIQVNVGDTFNYASLNHHIMDRGGVILDKKILDEAAQTHYILKRVAKWAKESHLIYGNHERFASDFIEKFPQFIKLLDFRFLCGLEELGYKLTSLKNVLSIGSAKFVHGEIKMYGQSGSKLEKTSRTFGKDIFIGHIHRPEIRFGCYSIGLTGTLDQQYNEPEASNWLHGFGMCNQFLGQSWLTTISIINNKCVLNKKTYKVIDADSWKIEKYKARMVYDFEGQR